MLIAMVVAVAVGVSSGGGGHPPSQVATTSKAIKAICQPNDYKQTCEDSLNIQGANLTNPKDLIMVRFEAAIDELKLAVKNTSAWKNANKDPKMDKVDITKPDDHIQNVKVFLSGAATFQESCLDEFDNVTGDFGEKMKKLLNTARQLTSNGLAMMDDFSAALDSLHVQITKRRLLSTKEFPPWINERRRRLFAETPGTIQADVIVAQDGSGKFKTISEALSLVPNDKKNPTNKTFVIYIKEGIYKEKVTVTKYKPNVMFIGDGAQKTKITSDKNFIDGANTMDSATVAVLGPSFIAKDIGFENTAGAEKYQAVALRVQADLAIFQNCKMIFRKPMADQAVIVTAQGRSDKNSVTGIVLQNCTITGDPEYVKVKDTNKGYLGRPWKLFSRTIYLQSEIEDVIQPDEWLPWNGNFALDTCWYAEYGNRGLGSDTAKRVTWPGIQKLSAQQATDFTVEKFVGVDWIKTSGVPFNSGMF
ncbi:hypothetical protein Pint_24469 [Pistacia integerrima]|uniref:Uncharacterized protein n=1 Tax=Pistacia integerrima TaxID=434235 RepID=A0ACC0YD93_9ROSI|nr:hypothetical protein Pint_24469 [Pistacia integerrima]